MAGNEVVTMMDEQRSHRDESSGIGLLDMFAIVLEHRMAVLKVTVAVTLVVTALSFLIPNRYVASAVVLPDVDILSAAQKLGNLQDIATSVGLNLGVTSPSQLYPDILQSETILKPVLIRKYLSASTKEPIDLIRYLDFDDRDTLLNYEEALKYFRKEMLSLDVNKKTGIIQLSVETTIPQLSADIANEMLSRLDQFQRNFRKTNATEQRKFIEQRLTDVRNDLSGDEDGLKMFREKNRRISDSPQLLLEEARLERNVTLNTALFVELRKQYELVRLDEIKNTPVVQVLDQARPPARKSGPKRMLVALATFVLTLLACAVWLISRKMYARMEEAGTLSPTFTRITGMLTGDLKSLRSRSKDRRSNTSGL
jgi:uncharacterized protein involved in exopolysaccharide biosynthesis